MGAFERVGVDTLLRIREDYVLSICARYFVHDWNVFGGHR